MNDETLVTNDRLADQHELSHWLALLHAPGIGPITLARLLDYYTEPDAILDAASKGELRQSGLLNKAGLKYLSNPNWAAVEHDLNWLHSAPNHYILPLSSPHYPVLLREIPDPPPLLFVKGDITLLNNPQLAIVGSRNPSPVGAEISHAFARDLAGYGLTITSGLALGVDAAAHYGALAANGHTIAVTGTGLDRVYPAAHRALAHTIADHGALVSEFPPGTEAKPHHFPRRNRLISGMSLGTLVTEAALRSGSLITAHQALEQGREVFAIPGSIYNPLARGCHALLRNGAKLVEEINDIIEELGHFLPTRPTTPPEQQKGKRTATGLDQRQQMVINNLGFEPTAMDRLIERTGLTADALSTILLTLELAGHVVATSGGHYMRCKPQG